jgi:hypothetical protein
MTRTQLATWLVGTLSIGWIPAGCSLFEQGDDDGYHGHDDSYYGSGGYYGTSTSDDWWCPSPSAFDHETYACICPGGELFAEHDGCLDPENPSVCPAPSIYIPEAQSCICPGGWEYDVLWGCLPDGDDSTTGPNSGTDTGGPQETTGASTTIGDTDWTTGATGSTGRDDSTTGWWPGGTGTDGTG